jgi:hypothetical protein
MTRRALLSLAALAAGLASGLALMTASAVAAGSLPTLTLSLTKNNVVVGGEKVSGAVSIVTTVSGEASDSPALILLKPGVTPSEFGHAVAKLGNSGAFDAIDPYGTIVFSGGDDPSGSPTTAQAVLPAGNYVAVNDGNALVPFTVAKAASPASLPKPGATVKAIEFGFRGASTLHDGELVRFENDGYLIHMFMWASTPSVADATKAEADLLKGDIPAAKKFATGSGQFAGPLSSGQMQQQTITEPPGVYVMFCSMSTQDGREHFQLGMYRTIHIVK